MSLGLDALNKLQRERAAEAAGGAALMLHPAAQAAAPANRLLAAGFLLSLAVATAALLHNRTGPGAVVAAVELAPPRAVATAGPGPVTFSVPNLAAPAPGQNALVRAWVDAGRVGGVDLREGTGLSPVVMFNDSICHANDLVNPVLGIRLARIEAQRLAFQDSRGIVYWRAATEPNATP